MEQNNSKKHAYLDTDISFNDPHFKIKSAMLESHNLDKYIVIES